MKKIIFNKNPNGYFLDLTFNNDERKEIDIPEQEFTDYLKEIKLDMVKRITNGDYRQFVKEKLSEYK